MEQKNVQDLQRQLRVIAQMHREMAERTMEAAGLLSKIVYEVCNQSKLGKPVFPENDYSTIVTQINTNPYLVKKRKWKSESWPRYAIRLSKFVGWSVDMDALRTSFALYSEH